jgi:hypothetical protein
MKGANLVHSARADPRGVTAADIGARAVKSVLSSNKST